MPELRQAYALLEIKSFDRDARTFEGIASTPTVDAGDDVMDPFGAEFRLPLPLLWQHGKGAIKDPVGWITHATATKAGINVRGNFASVTEPASLRDDLDRAWSLVKSGLVRGLSIGWRPLKGEPVKGTNVVKWVKWGWHELSAVAIPMNSEASITVIKSIDAAARASSGTSAPASKPRPGASGESSPRSRTMRTFQEQIDERRDERQAIQEKMSALLVGVDNDVAALEGDDASEFDTLGKEIKSVDQRIERLQSALAASGNAQPIEPTARMTPPPARVRAGDAQMKSNLLPGTMFARAVHSKVYGIKNSMTMRDVASYAKHTFPDTPEVADYLLRKAAVGTGASGNWAEPLNTVSVVEGEFIAELRPATIVGRLGLRPAPFNTKMIVQGPANSSANWVGNGAVKPVGEGVYSTVEILQHKIAEIIVLTEDQIMSSHIDSIEATRQDLIARIAQFADEQFTDPSVAATANNPASVLNGVAPVVSGGSTAEDLMHDIYALINQFNAANIPLNNVTLIMSSFVAWGISGLRNPFNVPIFPNVNMSGGSIDGMRIIVSNNVGGSSTGSNIIAVIPNLILLAQNGGIRVDLSREATVSMTGAATADHSLWQRNEVGLRCEWFVSWKKAHAEAANYISGAAYAPAAP